MTNNFFYSLTIIEEFLSIIKHKRKAQVKFKPLIKCYKARLYLLISCKNRIGLQYTIFFLTMLISGQKSANKYCF